MHKEGNTGANTYIIAISVSVIVALVAAVFYLTFKIRRLMTKQTKRPNQPTQMHHNNAFQSEHVDELPQEQGTNPRDIDLGSMHSDANDGDKSVRDFANLSKMSTRPLPSVPSERAKKYDSLARTKKYANNNPDEANAQTFEVHYMGLQRTDNNRAEGIATVNEPASYMALSPRRPEQVVYSGLSHNGGEAIKPKHRTQHGKKTKDGMQK